MYTWGLVKEIISAIIKEPCDFSSLIALFRNTDKRREKKPKKLHLNSSFINKLPLEHFVSKKENKVRKTREGETQPPRQMSFQKKEYRDMQPWLGLVCFFCPLALVTCIT